MNKPHKTKNVLIVSEHFYPSTAATAQLVHDLANGLARSNINVQVLTATPHAHDSCEQYPVTRISTNLASPSIILAKALKGSVFFAKSLIWTLRNKSLIDDVIIISNPPFIAALGLLLKALIGVEYIFVFQDIFPRSAMLTGIIPARGPALAFWHLLMRKAIKHSKSTIVLSDSMKKRVYLDFNVTSNVSVIPNWSIAPLTSKPKRLTSLASELNIQDKFIVQYSGNYGRLHDILSILEAARILQEHKDIVFLFVGGGYKEKQIQAYKSMYRMNNVILLPYQPRETLSDSLSACDVSLVSLIPGADDTVAPSKLYGILSSSRPVILLATHRSCLAATIRSRRIGVVVENGDVDHLCKTLVQLKDQRSILDEYAVNAGNYSRQHCTFEDSLRSYIQVLTSD